MNPCFSHSLNTSPATNCIFLSKIVSTKTDCLFIWSLNCFSNSYFPLSYWRTHFIYIFLCFRISNYFLKAVFIVYFDIFNLLSTHPTLKTPIYSDLIFASKFKLFTFFLSEFVIFVNTCCSLCSYIACAFYHTYLWWTLCKSCINLQNCMFHTKIWVKKAVSLMFGWREALNFPR